MQNATKRTLEEDTEHLKVFHKICNLIAMFGKPFGIRTTYDWKPERSILFWATISILIFTWFNIFYTQYIHLTNHDHMKVIEVFAVYGISSSVALKAVAFLKYRNKILSLLFFIKKFCRQNINGRRADILKNHLCKTYRFLKMFPLCTLICFAAFVACPLKSYIVDNKLLSPFPIEIVFVNQTTTAGFFVANSIISTMGTLAYLFDAFFGLTFIFCVLNYAIQIELIDEDFKTLNAMWVDNTGGITVAEKRAFLKNICMKFQDVNNYVTEIKDIFDNKTFLYFCSNYACQIICMFEIAVMKWKFGYVIAVGLFMEMMFYCYLGTQISISNEKLCAIINTSNWYDYDSQSQKIVLLLLISSQNANELQIGPFAPLTVATGLEIYKSIYCYYAVLIEFF